MPRSKVRPNVATYHDAIDFLIYGLGLNLTLPLNKKQDKFSAKSLAYLCGFFKMPIDTSVKVLWEKLSIDYGAPEEFITWVRVLQQIGLGVEVPEKYGDYDTNFNLIGEYVRLLQSEYAAISDDGEEEFSEEYFFEDPSYGDHVMEDVYGTEESTDQVDSVVASVATSPKPDWDTLAAQNPAAAAFVLSLIKETDQEELWGTDETNQEEDDGYGDQGWGTDGFSEEGEE